MKHLILIAAVALGGCTSYSHERFSEGGQRLEKTSFSAPWLTKTAVAGLKTKVTDNRALDGITKYSRSVGVDGVAASTDAEGINALESLIGRALIQGLSGGTFGSPP